MHFYRTIPSWMLAIALLLCTALPLQARKYTYKLADWGITPNTATDTQMAGRLAKILNEIREKVTDNDQITIIFDKGNYHLYTEDATPCELYISNHDQNQPKRVGLLLNRWNNLTLDGNGSEFICHGRILPIALTQSTNCTLKNLSVDFVDPQIAQVQILKNIPDEGITFEVASWVNYRIAGNGRWETYGRGWTQQPIYGMAFERDTKRIVYNTSDLVINTQGVKDLGGRQILAPEWKDPRLTPGTIVTMRTGERPAPGVFLANSTDTRLENIKIHFAEGMGLLAQRCTNISLNKVCVCLRGNEDPRYFTTQADATHFSQCRGKITSKNGLYENMMDDAINIHGVYLRIGERLDDHTLRCTYGHGQAWGFDWGDVGDEVCFVQSATMEDLGQNNIITNIRPDGQDSIKGCKGFIITLRDKLPDGLQGGNLYGIENLTWTPEVKFSRNIIRNNRARGALFSSPRRTVCEDNLFDHTSGTAILLCGDCNGWFESGAVHDLVIRRNTFINALTSMYQFTNAVISIYPEIPQLDKQRKYFHGGKQGAIRIEHNNFDTFDAPLLYAKSVNGLIFRKNEVRHNTEYKPFHWNKEAVKLEHCTDTDIEM